MSLPVAYLPEAQDDIDLAYAQYEQRRAGLGDRFLDELRQVIMRVADTPELYGTIPQDVHAAPVRRFPHVVYYRVEPHQVLVIAVQHGRRNPAAWQQRS